MSDEDKKPFVDLAHADAVRHAAELAEYQKSHNMQLGSRRKWTNDTLEDVSVDCHDLQLAISDPNDDNGDADRKRGALCQNSWYTRSMS